MALQIILLATDAWLPQVNGVVRTYQRMAAELEARGIGLLPLSPDQFRSVPCPTYPEIRLALCRASDVAKAMSATGADAIHIATEGPIGWAARRWCLKTGTPFTTSFHTRFPEYVAARFPMPARASYALLRRFHNAGKAMLVSTPSLARELNERGFSTVNPWTRGVDTDLFRPRNIRLFGDGPVMLYVGRIAVEKNLEAFLKLDLPGQKVVIGVGPAREQLMADWPTVLFPGKLEGDELAEAYASADVFVFPSRTDTFGIVMLEAMASGIPVAAYPVTGPIDVVTEGETGVLNKDLGTAITQALNLDRDRVRQGAEKYSWGACADQFLAAVAAAHSRAC